MTISIEYGAYNFRRYGKPWIGVITNWEPVGLPEIRWGVYVGDKDGGITEVEAVVGDIVRYGQRDIRKPQRSSNEWAIVQEDGTLLDCTPAEARKHWNQRQEKTNEAMEPAEV